MVLASRPSWRSLSGCSTPTRERSQDQKTSRSAISRKNSSSRGRGRCWRRSCGERVKSSTSNGSWPHSPIRWVTPAQPTISGRSIATGSFRISSKHLAAISSKPKLAAFLPASDSPRQIWTPHWATCPVAGRCGRPLPGCYCKIPIVFCWTSRPTISMLIRWRGWKISFVTGRVPFCSFLTIATSLMPWLSG